MTSTIYIAPTGSDSNAGTYASPMKTLNGAKNALTNKSGTILVRGGIYLGDRLDISDVTDIKVLAVNNERPRFIFGEKLSGITKTSGYANVYQANALTLAEPRGFIYEDGTAYGEITQTELRHPLQAGRTHRCDASPLIEAESIADVDSAPASYFFDDATNVVYFHAPDGDNPTNRDYYVPWRVGMVWNGADKQTGRVELSGLRCDYADTAFNLSYAASYKMTDCVAVGARINGVQADNIGFGEELMCEAYLCGNDGFNYHNSTGTNKRESKIVQLHPYAHDNFDDGISPHENAQTFTAGGLSEYNRDRGFAAATGAHSFINGMVVRCNGMNNQEDIVYKGEGFASVGDPISNENGMTTDLYLQNCIALDNMDDVGSELTAANNIVVQDGYIGDDAKRYWQQTEKPVEK